jgi:DNA-binding response OmpR family regulator
MNNAGAFSILSFGYDLVLMPIRTLLLENAGYHTVEVFSWGETLKQLKANTFDLLLICHSVPAEEQAALVESIRPLRRTLPILCLSTTPFKRTAHNCASACSVAPEFLDEVRKVLPRAS